MVGMEFCSKAGSGWGWGGAVVAVTVAGLLWSDGLGAGEPWSVESFPDEAGFRERAAGMLERFAEEPILERAMARSVCPDTGREVLTWAVEGEVIRSPYTGREYVQGDTGYFGPKAKNEAGEVTAFGGDPLKHTLGFAVARFLLEKEDEELKRYLGFPGTLRQQYHFAAVNWGRFWPQFHEKMGEAWNEKFLEAVGRYAERGEPSHARRENAPIRLAQDLVGDVRQHLGGGGTENHRTMWRTTGLLYAQILPEGSRISGHSLEEAEAATKEVLGRYVEGLYKVGSGEYSSSIYYPYSIRGFLNLYDFSPEEETRAMAKAALDYYAATYGLKVFNGMQTGAQRRGYVESHGWNEMDRFLWAWLGAGTRPVEGDGMETVVHQLNTGYRPNALISALVRKEAPLPFEAWINHPTYEMSASGHHLEYYYCDEEFSLGSVQLPEVNNSGQQTTWVLAMRGDSGDTVTVTGGQPRWVQRGGHSPYDQYIQWRNVLLYMMDQTSPGIYSNLPEPLESRSQILGHLNYDRYTARAGWLEEQAPPTGDDEGEWEAFLEGGFRYAATWLWLPRKDLEVELVAKDAVVFRCGRSRVLLYPFGGEPILLAPDVAGWRREKGKARERFAVDRLLVIPGAPSGFAMEVLEVADSEVGGFDPGRLDVRRLEDEQVVRFETDSAGALELRYQGQKLRPEASLNGRSLIPQAWEGRGHVDSPYLKIKDSAMWVSDGERGYEMDAREAN